MQMGGDKKEPATCRGKYGRHLRRAKTVRVGLDDSGTICGCNLRRQRPPIGDDAREIHFEHGAGTVDGIAGRTLASFAGHRISGR